MAQAGNYLRGVQEAGGPVFQVGGRGPPGSEVQPGQDPQVNEEHQSPPTPLLLSSPVKPEDSCWSLRAVCTDYNSPCFYVWKYTCRRTNKRNLECITKSCCFESCQADTTVELRGFAKLSKVYGKGQTSIWILSECKMEMLRSVLGGSDTGPAPVSPAETIGSDLLKKCCGLELKGSEIFFDAVLGKAFTAPMPNLKFVSLGCWILMCINFKEWYNLL